MIRTFKSRMDKGKVIYDPTAMKLVIIASFIIVFAIVLIGSLSYFITQNAVVNKLKEKDLTTIVESVSTKIEARIDRAIETSSILANDPEVLNWLEEGKTNKLVENNVTQKLKVIATEFDYSNAFLANSRTGDYWTEVGLMDQLSKQNQNDSWFYKTIHSKTPVQVVIDYNKARNETFIFINRLMGDANNPLAVVGVGLSLKELSDAFDSYRYGENSRLWLINDQGDIYLSDTLDERGLSINHFVPDHVKNGILQEISKKPKDPHVMEYKDREGNLKDLISYPIQSTKWHILYQIDRSETVSFLSSVKWNTFIAAFITILAVIFIFHFISHYLANPFKRAVQINQELENKVAERTRELAEKNQAVMDSIDYAKRIQESILPVKDEWDSQFRESFLLWKPKDVVGGDFYWAKRWNENECLIVVGDCTGHGVPGALMTMVTISILNQLAETECKRDPASMLEQLNHIMKRTLHREPEESFTDEGVDLGICYVKDKRILTFAGAKNSLYVKSDQGIEVIKGNKKSVGYRKNPENYKYDNRELTIEESSVFYLTTDGYLDQNGGEKDFSFGRKKFIDLIQRCSNEPLAAQRDLFSQALTDYKGKEPQRDDITVLAFRV